MKRNIMKMTGFRIIFGLFLAFFVLILTANSFADLLLVILEITLMAARL